jgi:hypothetical protein
MNLAQCHENEGKLASALDEYRDALKTAQKDGRKDRADIARGKVAELEKSVPRVVVTMKKPPAGTDVKLDSTPIGQASFGVATPVDPGAHTVSATAPGYVYLTLHVDIEPGERKVVDVVLERETTPDGDVKPEPAKPPPPPVRTKPNPVFWAALGTGVGGFLVSTITGVAMLNNLATANDGCDNDRHFCKDTKSTDAHFAAHYYALASTIALGVSAVGFVVAMIVPSRKPIRLVGQNGLELRF